MRYSTAILLFGSLFVTLLSVFAQERSETCDWNDQESSSCADLKVQQQQSQQHKDPNLKPMKVEFEDGTTNEDFYAYVLPDISTFYSSTTTQRSRKVTETRFRGLMAKFINMSEKRVKILWTSRNKNQDPVYIALIEPFGAAGTASYPDHHFLVADASNPSIILDEFHVVKENSLYVYDPFGSMEEASKVLDTKAMEAYTLQYRNLEFNAMYQNFTGRQWLGLYGRKKAPRYPMWEADYFGQVHNIVTEETHVKEFPPDELAKAISHTAGKNAEHRKELQKYRGPEKNLTLNMTVISIAPRAFEIPNFLSETEVLHILEVATGMKLHQSTTKAGSQGGERTDDATRTSTNSWLAREKTVIIDSIIRRSADLLQVSEALFRKRKEGEHHLVPENDRSIVERLQLVHYDVGQQYTPHHDFSIPNTVDGQPSRFATILFYLNDVPEGGETSFPRWMNGEGKDILKVKPEVGKAVLFYDQLPDGNYDERSQHAALPVIKGEKWLTNLWVWDPYMS